MDIKKERARVERLEKLIDLYEIADQRIESDLKSYRFYSQSIMFLHIHTLLKEKYSKRVESHREAKKRIELAYKLTLNS